MDRKSRRHFIGFCVATLSSSRTRAQSTIGGVSKPRVVIIGGGAGGASAAKIIAQKAADKIDLTLVEANPLYQSCFFSNHFIGGLRAFETLSHDYAALRSRLPMRVVTDRAIAVDTVTKKIKLEKGFLHYDLLVLAPGIDFIEESVKGWSFANQNAMPHAYRGGEQVRLLKAQIDQMPQGGVFAIVPPAGKYRCPPGPYERVCVIANLLRKTNPTAKIIIADPKPVFSKMGLFREAWKKYYKGMIDMNSDVDMSSFEVDTGAMTLKLGGETIKVDVCNVIPAQKAGLIAVTAGITRDGWAPVHAEDMRSKVDEHIYVLGDAAEQGAMPKSAFSANSQAKVCAESIISRLTGSSVSVPHYRNTCWSFVADGNSVKIGANYRAGAQGIEKVEGFSSRRNEDETTRMKTYQESLDWYRSITRDMFESDA